MHKDENSGGIEPKELPKFVAPVVAGDPPIVSVLGTVVEDDGGRGFLEPLIFLNLEQGLKVRCLNTEKINPESALGSGQFGEVSLATWDGQKVAYKRVKKIPNSVMEIKNEVKRLVQLKHSRIVAFYGVQETEDYVIFVMEYCHQGDLLRYLRQHKDILWQKKQGFLIDIARALAFIHIKNILHNDLCASNVLVTCDEKAKLADFGLTRTSNRFPKSGRPCWMAPELLQLIVSTNSHLTARGEPTTASDMYSFGVLMWEVATQGGDAMFDHRALEVNDSIFNGNRHLYVNPIPEETPLFIKELIIRCWSVQPEERPAAKELVKYLSQERSYLLEESILLESPSVEQIRKKLTLFSRQVMDRISKRFNDDKIYLAPVLSEISPQVNFLIIYGKAGVGKTLYLVHYAHKLLTKDSLFVLMPLNMLEVEGEDAEALLQAIFKRAGLNQGDIHLLKTQKIEIYLLLDGYDEMTASMTEVNIPFLLRQAMVSYNLKVVLTCRKEKFLSKSELIYRPVNGVRQQAIEISPFTQAQVKKYLLKNLETHHDKYSTIYKFCKENVWLHVPLLLKLLVKIALDDAWNLPTDFSLVQVYGQFFKRWVEEKSEECPEAGELSEFKQKFDIFCEDFALTLFAEGKSAVAYRKKRSVEEEVEENEYDAALWGRFFDKTYDSRCDILLRCAPIEHTSLGYWQFLHHTFFEYFLVCGIFRRFKEFLFKKTVSEFSCYAVARILNQRQITNRLCSLFWQRIYLYISQNNLKLKKVLNNLLFCLNKVKNKFGFEVAKKNLFFLYSQFLFFVICEAEFVAEKSFATFEQINSGAISRQDFSAVSCAGVDFFWALLRDVSLAGMDFSGSDFSQAHMLCVNFSKANLDGVILNKVKKIFFDEKIIAFSYLLNASCVYVETAEKIYIYDFFKKDMLTSSVESVEFFKKQVNFSVSLGKMRKLIVVNKRNILGNLLSFVEGDLKVLSLDMDIRQKFLFLRLKKNDSCYGFVWNIKAQKLAMMIEDVLAVGGDSLVVSVGETTDAQKKMKGRSDFFVVFIKKNEDFGFELFIRRPQKSREESRFFLSCDELPVLKVEHGVFLCFSKKQLWVFLFKNEKFKGFKLDLSEVLLDSEIVDVSWAFGGLVVLTSSARLMFFTDLVLDNEQPFTCVYRYCVTIQLKDFVAANFSVSLRRDWCYLISKNDILDMRYFVFDVKKKVFYKICSQSQVFSFFGMPFLFCDDERSIKYLPFNDVLQYGFQSHLSCDGREKNTVKKILFEKYFLPYPVVALSYLDFELFSRDLRGIPAFNQVLIFQISENGQKTLLTDSGFFFYQLVDDMQREDLQFKQEITELAYDGKYFYIGTDVGEILMWSVSDRRLIKRLDIFPDFSIRGIKIFNRETPKIIVWGDDDEIFLIPGVTPAEILENFAILLVDGLDDGKIIRKFLGHRASVNSVALTKDQCYLISGGADKTLRYWDINTAACIGIFETKEEIKQIAVDSCASYVVANEYKRITVWKILAKNGAALQQRSLITFKGKHAPYQQMTVNEAGNLIVAVGGSGIDVFHYHIAVNDQVYDFTDQRQGKSLDNIPPHLVGAEIAFSEDEKKLIFFDHAAEVVSVLPISELCNSFSIIPHGVSYLGPDFYKVPFVTDSQAKPMQLYITDEYVTHMKDHLPQRFAGSVITDAYNVDAETANYLHRLGAIGEPVISASESKPAINTTDHERRKRKHGDLKGGFSDTSDTNQVIDLSNMWASADKRAKLVSAAPSTAKSYGDESGGNSSVMTSREKNMTNLGEGEQHASIIGLSEIKLQIVKESAGDESGSMEFVQQSNTSAVHLNNEAFLPQTKRRFERSYQAGADYFYTKLFFVKSHVYKDAIVIKFFLCQNNLKNTCYVSIFNGEVWAKKLYFDPACLGGIKERYFRNGRLKIDCINYVGDCLYVGTKSGRIEIWRHYGESPIIHLISRNLIGFPIKNMEIFNPELQELIVWRKKPDICLDPLENGALFLRYWNSEKGKHEWRALVGHGDVVTAVSWSSDKRYLFTAEKYFRVWWTATGRCLWKKNLAQVIRQILFCEWQNKFVFLKANEMIFPDIDWILDQQDKKLIPSFRWGSVPKLPNFEATYLGAIMGEHYFYGKSGIMRLDLKSILPEMVSFKSISPQIVSFIESDRMALACNNKLIIFSKLFAKIIVLPIGVASDAASCEYYDAVTLQRISAEQVRCFVADEDWKKQELAVQEYEYAYVAQSEVKEEKISLADDEWINSVLNINEAGQENPVENPNITNQQARLAEENPAAVLVTAVNHSLAEENRTKMEMDNDPEINTKGLDPTSSSYVSFLGLGSAVSGLTLFSSPSSNLERYVGLPQLSSGVNSGAQEGEQLMEPQRYVGLPQPQVPSRVNSGAQGEQPMESQRYVDLPLPLGTANQGNSANSTAHLYSSFPFIRSSNT